MKIPHKSKEKKDNGKKREVTKPKEEQVLIVAQEIKFARLLSGNEKKSRDKVLKTLKKWLQNCFEKKYEFKEDDFVRVWKGLFYAVWMSDKPLIQEELCENISGVLDLFPAEQLKDALLMYRAGLRVLATEWYGVDHHRMDKFLMLVRRYLRASLRCLARCDWSLPSCRLYTKALSDNDGILSLMCPRYARNATSMVLHLLDCYLEEIAKVSAGAVPRAALAELLRPVCRLVCAAQQPLVVRAARRLLTALLRQSEPGLRYQHATSAWQKMGCPKGGPEALELVSDDEEGEQNGDDNSDGDDDNAEKPLDPRAGRVNVELPLLPVPADLLADMLRDMLASATSKAHKRIKICLQRFEQLCRDEYPLRVQDVLDEESAPPETAARAAHSLQALEKQLLTESDELALRGLSRKHRKRLLAKSRSGASIVEQVERVRHEATSATNGEWQVESAEPALKNHSEEDTSSKENKKRKIETKGDRHNKKRKIEKISGDVTNKRKGDSAAREIDNTSSIKSRNDSNKVKNKSKHEKSTNINSKMNGVKEIEVINNKKEVNKHIKDKKNKEEHKKQEKLITNGHVKQTDTTNMKNKNKKGEILTKSVKRPSVLVNKVKNFQKQSGQSPSKSFDTPKRVKFVLKNNSMQAPVDYYKSIRQSPSIPFDGTKQPAKTNLKPSTPSPINPFFKKKLKLKR